MRLGIFAVGRMKSGPEKELAGRYLQRLSMAGRNIGIDYDGLVEAAESRARSCAQRRQEEGRLLIDHADGAMVVLLDERGKNIASADFARHIGRMRDDGARSMLFAIGGPDGHGEEVREHASLTLAFGAQTWPHQLMRVMLAEQLYRAVTILAGHPYHRQ